MPTIAGFRRRGVPPEAIRDFIKRIGVAKATAWSTPACSNSSSRDANKTALRRMAVLRPAQGRDRELSRRAVGRARRRQSSRRCAAGSRKIKFSRELYIEHEDFMEVPQKKFFRLSPGTEVRPALRLFHQCTEVVKNSAGEVTELRCTLRSATKGGNAPDGRK